MENEIKEFDVTQEIIDLLRSNLDNEQLKERLDEFTKDLSSNNEVLIQNLKAQLDDMTKYVDSVLDIQTQEADAHIDEFAKLIEELNVKLFAKTDELKNIINEQVELSNQINNDFFVFF